ncbi:unnamed protein product [Rotaria sp. Silwood2]|nr:unnamed protein product [Rotaria sp. Silwood2]CAF4525028.1 unnamed protein product [Rotaria sp. Silwood2]
MSKQHNISNLNDNDHDDPYSSSDENEIHSIASNRRDSTALGESPADETSQNLQQITSIVHSMNSFLFQLIIDILDEQINRLIIYHESTISIEDWFILMWFCLFFYQCSELLLLIRNICILTIYRRFPWDRDAQAEDRTAHPTDEILALSTTMMIINDEPLAIVDMQRHDSGVLADVNYTRPTCYIINDKNSYVNEDATLYTDSINNIIVPIVQNSVNIQITNSNENDTSETVVDDPTYNINPLDSAESQDDTQLNDSSDEAVDNIEINLINFFCLDHITSSDSGFDNEDHSADDNEQRGQTLPHDENLNNHVENNNSLDQTNPVNEQQATTNIVLSPNEPMEIHNISSPMEGSYQTVSDATHLTHMVDQKRTNPTGLTTESSKESIN